MKFKDPRDACAAIVAESYRLWLQYETRTDDITVIIVHVNGLTEVWYFSFFSCFYSFIFFPRNRHIFIFPCSFLVTNLVFQFSLLLVSQQVMVMFCETLCLKL